MNTMNTQQIPNQVKFVYLITVVARSEQDIQANQEIYRIRISHKNKKFYLFNIRAYIDVNGDRLFYFSDLLAGILSYQHKDLLLKRLDVPGYDGYINKPINHQELNICIDIVFKRTRNILYDGQGYSKGRLAYDILENLYRYIDEHQEGNEQYGQDNDEPLMLENLSPPEEYLSVNLDNEITSNYSDEGDSIDAFVKIKNPDFYGEFILSIQKNSDGTVNATNIKRFNYLVDKLQELLHNLIKVSNDESN